MWSLLVGVACGCPSKMTDYDDNFRSGVRKGLYTTVRKSARIVVQYDHSPKGGKSSRVIFVFQVFEKICGPREKANRNKPRQIPNLLV